eukprot:CAMPEP_0114584832 /NCGR_PEP_ID=MMETSP0125-20121206/8465_1 /TAXON_ID=485358 ORGANISM="Aristerostoma sp., Strain ATCC 50986" /NCGR_SAMPLE_ID=MMETSP0125 /ASSEMBLY_ACC=CAM_ASM_000245 /LENGTH=136 /DNA_ID=CAMNT_0001779483 /DNA_START=1595 /DNA_END=2005 /DNA_ORIENTATION=-
MSYKSLKGHSDKVRGADFCGKGGNGVVSISDDGTLKYWDLSEEQPKSKNLADELGKLDSLTVSADGSLVCCGGENMTLTIKQIDSGVALAPQSKFHGKSDYIDIVEASPNGDKLYIKSESSIKIWDLAADRISSVI